MARQGYIANWVASLKVWVNPLMINDSSKNIHGAAIAGKQIGENDSATRDLRSKARRHDCQLWTGLAYHREPLKYLLGILP